ncbi:hypothetical protein KBZ75_05535 [Streptomyces sp. RK76]|nr:hypothetical protein [Streptomyces sp. RK76]
MPPTETASARTRHPQLPQQDTRVGLATALREHMEAFPPVDVTLPWLTPTGPKATHRLLFTGGIGAAIWSQAFNDQSW